ncbi:hypothetical protein MRX96_022660 [Rhipicephalus microplus]
MLQRAAREANFAQWLLRVASSYAAGASPPERLPVVSTLGEEAVMPREAEAATTSTPEVAPLTQGAGRR